jgi:hypothetical protein
MFRSVAQRNPVMRAKPDKMPAALLKLKVWAANK